MWYIYTQDNSQGPYSTEDILLFRNQGSINGETYLWRDGFAEWTPLAQISELNASPAPESRRSFAPRAGASSSNLTACPACGSMNRPGAKQCASCLAKFDEWKRAEENPAEAATYVDKRDSAYKSRNTIGRIVPERLIPESRTTRTTGVSILCGLIAIGIFLQAVLLFSDIGRQVIDESAAGGSASSIVFFMRILLLGSVLSLFGLWNMKRWGVLVYTVTSVVDFGLGFAMGAGSSGIVLRAIIIIALFKKWDEMD